MKRTPLGQSDFGRNIWPIWAIWILHLEELQNQKSSKTLSEYNKVGVPPGFVTTAHPHPRGMLWNSGGEGAGVGGTGGWGGRAVILPFGCPHSAGRLPGLCFPAKPERGHLSVCTAGPFIPRIQHLTCQRKAGFLPGLCWAKSQYPAIPLGVGGVVTND